MNDDVDLVTGAHDARAGGREATVFDTTARGAREAGANGRPDGGDADIRGGDQVPAEVRDARLAPPVAIHPSPEGEGA